MTETLKKQAWYCETCHTRTWEAEAEIERLTRELAEAKSDHEFACKQSAERLDQLTVVGQNYDQMHAALSALVSDFDANCDAYPVRSIKLMRAARKAI